MYSCAGLCFWLLFLSKPSRSRSNKVCRTRSTSSSLVNFSSSHWWSNMRLSPRGRQPCKFSSPRTYVELVSSTLRCRLCTPIRFKLNVLFCFFFWFQLIILKDLLCTTFKITETSAHLFYLNVCDWLSTAMFVLEKV